MSQIHCKSVKPNVAHGVKADRLSSFPWKDILDVHCTDRVTIAAYGPVRTRTKNSVWCLQKN